MLHWRSANEHRAARRSWLTAVLVVAVMAGLHAAPAAASCLVLGDSLAQGIAAQAPDCQARAVKGINSAAFARSIQSQLDADLVVISLGANDGADMRTADDLVAVRMVVRAQRVVWIMPALPSAARAAISLVAEAFRDGTLDTKDGVGPDGLHLTAEGYLAVALLTRLRSMPGKDRH